MIKASRVNCRFHQHLQAVLVLTFASCLAHIAAAQSNSGFAAATSYPVSQRPSNICIADLNGDGWQDIATANYTGTFGNASSGTLSVLLNNQDGTFAPAVVNSVTPYHWGLTVADVNNDSKPDLVSCALWNGDVTVLLGKGNGTYNSPIYSTLLSSPFDFADGIQPQNVAVGDLNGDANPDVAVVNQNGFSYAQGLSVLLGNGTGQFHSPTSYVSVMGRSVVMADFDGGGKLDIAVAAADGPGISVLLNNGDGTFGTTTNFDTGGSAAMSLVAQDFNGDGKIDLATANNDTQSLSVLLGTGDGRFTNPSVYQLSDHARGLTTADLDGDGKADLISSSWDGNVIVLRGRGDGSFDLNSTNFVGGVSFAVASGDFDRNGAPDLVHADYTNHRLNVLLNSASPRLFISFTNNQTVLNWPDLELYSLETTTDLTSDNWTAITNSISTANGRRRSTNSLSSSAAFYRLKKENP